ncbi:MAG: hypothetical protein Ct9H300mP32_5450 [Verrucomicrobiota bacterium]|nr:MAG: hypothetical protein Ct9H300mP32_5450 [Verrucomicrobiota bacterium]
MDFRVLCSDRLRWPLSVQSRWQVPAAVRPALPARWSAEARLISSINSVPKPRSASKRATRARPKVYDVADAVDGYRGLGDVGGDDDFAAVVSGKGAILIGRRKVAM